MIDNTALQAAIAYFEDAVRESDEIIEDCSPDLQRDLTEQKAHFVVALEVLRRVEIVKEPLTHEEISKICLRNYIRKREEEQERCKKH